MYLSYVVLILSFLLLILGADKLTIGILVSVAFLMSPFGLLPGINLGTKKGIYWIVRAKERLKDMVAEDYKIANDDGKLVKLDSVYIDPDTGFIYKQYSD